LVTVAVAIASRNLRAAACVNRARTVANTTRVERAYTWVNIVTRAIAVRISRTRTAAHAEGIELVSIAVAITGRNLCAAAGVNRARTVANATRVERAYTCVDIVAGTISVRISCACTAAHAEGVELVSIAVAITGRNLCATAGINRARTVADTTRVE
jgi:hypothetical protein